MPTGGARRGPYRPGGILPSIAPSYAADACPRSFRPALNCPPEMGCGRPGRRPAGLRHVFNMRRRAGSRTVRRRFTNRLGVAERAPIPRRPAGELGLPFVSGRWPALRPPSGRRRHVEQRLVRQHVGRPGLIGRVVAGDAPLAAGPYRAGDQGDVVRVDETALGVARLWPRVGEQQEQPVEARLGESARAAVLSVVGPERGDWAARGPSASPPSGTRRGEQRADAVLDTPRRRSARRSGWAATCGARVLAAAEAHFEPHRGQRRRRWAWERIERRDGHGRGRTGEPGQRDLEQQPPGAGAAALPRVRP